MNQSALGKLTAFKSGNLRHAPMIVQCPSCQTKFALDQNAVAEVERILKRGAEGEEIEVLPRFHCSRCDHVFTLEDSESGFQKFESATQERILTPEPPPIFEEGADVEDLDGFPAPKLASDYKGFEIPNTVVESLRSEPPHETIRQEPVQSEGLLHRTVQSAARDRTQMELNLSLNRNQDSPLLPSEFSEPLKDKNRPYDFSENASALSSIQDINRTFEDAASPDFVSPLSSSLNFPTSLALPQSLLSLSPWRGLMIVVAPLVFFLSLLILASLYLRSDPESTVAASNSLFPASVRVPPSGLFLKGARLRKVALDNGDTAYVVSGKIMNDTGHDFTEVVLEAIAFDSLGKPIQRTAIYASNSLAKAKVRSLTLEMIRALQTTKPSKSYRLRAGEESDFAVALSGGGVIESGDASELVKARYFSARIHSVKQ